MLFVTYSSVRIGDINSLYMFTYFVMRVLMTFGASWRIHTKTGAMYVVCARARVDER